MLKKCIFATTILLALMFGAFVVRASTASAIDQKPTPAMVTQIA